MTANATAFEHAATRVLTRVLLLRWMRLLGRTALPMVIALGLAVAARIFGSLGAWAPCLALFAWLLITAFWIWQHRPSKYAALALWDDTRKRSEATATAWWFEQQSSPTLSQKQHIESQQAALPEALAHLPRDLPLQPARVLYVLSVLFVLSLVASLLRPLAPGDTRLTDAMRDAAVSEGKKLATNTLDKKQLTGLTEQEKLEVEKLKQDVQSTAKSIEQGDSDTARGLLSDLEKRARDAEKLAQKLGDSAQSWASDKLIAAMRTHADTADLGDALAAKNAPHSAAAAEALGAQLKQKELASDTRDRIAATLDDIAKAAETEDRKRFAGEHVLAASDAMQKQDAVTAGQEFEALAEKMSDAAKREQAKRELEKLAQQLRDAGSRIAGQKGGGMENMAEAGKSENQPQAQANAASAQQMQAQQMMQPPGINQQQPPQSPDQNGQKQTMTMAQDDAQQGQGQPGQQGSGNASEGKPMLLAPIPGAKPDQQPSMLLSSPDIKADTPPTGSIAMPGGPKPGQGTAKLNNTPTVAEKAKKTSQVEAKPSGDGPSSTRSIEGGIRTEASAREAQAATLELIKEQEAALDDSSLPAARREQVRRYFGELRKRFEQK